MDEHRTVNGAYHKEQTYFRATQLVECSPINLLACASVGSNPVTATLCP